MALEPTAGIIEILKKQLGLDEDLMALAQIWEREAGSLAKYAKVLGIRRGQLIVDVSSSAHMQELAARKKNIIKNINQHFGAKKIIKDIKIQLG